MPSGLEFKPAQNSAQNSTPHFSKTYKESWARTRSSNWKRWARWTQMKSLDLIF